MKRLLNIHKFRLHFSFSLYRLKHMQKALVTNVVAE